MQTSQPLDEVLDELYGELDREHGKEPGWSRHPSSAYMRGYGRHPRQAAFDEQRRQREMLMRGWTR